MKIKLYLPAFLILGVVSCTAQSNQIRPVSSFTEIVVSGALKVEYTNSDSSSLSVKAKDHDMKNVETEIKNGVLYVSNKGQVNAEVVVSVKNPSLKSIRISGASEFSNKGTYSVTNLEVSSSGSSELRLLLNCKSVSCQQSGASKIRLSGHSDTLRADIAGASNFGSFQLESDVVNVSTSGASVAKIKGNKVVHANATGASEIKIKGNPSELSAEASTAANITRVVDNSQSKESSTDTTVYNLKNRKIIVIGKEEDEEDKDEDEPSFKHWHGFSMGVNGYVNPNYSSAMTTANKYMDLDYSRSFNFQFNIIERQFNIVNDYFKVVTGFGFDYHIYALANRTVLNPDSSYTSGITDNDPAKSFEKNRFRNTYIQVPLLLEVNTSSNPKKTFHIAAGVVGQYLISSRTKQVFVENGNKQTKIKRDNFNLRPIAAKALVNVGYRNFTVFGEYSLTSLFQKNKGPELYPFTLGVRLVNFS